jgi:uncharacterized protein
MLDRFCHGSAPVAQALSDARVDGAPSDAERAAARDRPAGVPVMRQVWRHLGFLHWPVEAHVVARLLPPGLDVDTFGGQAYVGIVPFTVRDSRVARLGLPALPAFHELNLRTYVHQRGRAPGVWFFSLDAASRLAVVGARSLYRLPYFLARMSLVKSGDPARPAIAYASRRERRGADDDRAVFRGGYRPVGDIHVAKPGTLEFFLIERYRLYAWTGRKIRTARVCHAPYPVQAAEAGDVAETLFRAAGLPAATGPATQVHYARQVDVEIWLPGPPT